MKTKILKFIKAKLAAWVLSDPSILIQNNNQFIIEEKYEVVELHATTDRSAMQTMLEKGMDIHSIQNMLAHNLSYDISERNLIEFKTSQINRFEKPITVLTASIKILKPKLIK